MKPKFKNKNKKKGHGSNNEEEIDIKEDEEIEILSRKVVEEAPARGSQLDKSKSLIFADMPLSRRTKQALSDGNFEVIA